jgi:hypothetical protein
MTTAHRRHIDQFNKRTTTMTYRVDYSAGRMIARLATAKAALDLLPSLGTVVMVEEDAENPGHYDAAILVGLADLRIVTITPEA